MKTFTVAQIRQSAEDLEKLQDDAVQWHSALIAILDKAGPGASVEDVLNIIDFAKKVVTNLTLLPSPFVELQKVEKKAVSKHEDDFDDFDDGTYRRGAVQSKQKSKSPKSPQITKDRLLPLTGEQFDVPISVLKQFASFIAWPWEDTCPAPSKLTFSRLLRQRGTLAHQIKDPLSATAEDHVRRIKYFMTHRTQEPIVIDFRENTVDPSLDVPYTWPLTDGAHRLLAAIFSRDTKIEVKVWGPATRAMHNLELSHGEVAAACVR